MNVLIVRNRNDAHGVQDAVKLSWELSAFMPPGGFGSIHAKLHSTACPGALLWCGVARLEANADVDGYSSQP